MSHIDTYKSKEEKIELVEFPLVAFGLFTTYMDINEEATPTFGGTKALHELWENRRNDDATSFQKNVITATHNGEVIAMTQEEFDKHNFTETPVAWAKRRIK